MRKVPDYISPIISYRAWRWDVAGLRSLNGELWQPGEPLEAGCRVSDFALLWGRAKAGHSPHDAPQIDCTCGIYASKSLEHLPKYGFERSRIHGQVSLWGTVVEHQHGWRAQYAYPKTFFLQPEVLPLTLREIQAGLAALISYRCDIFISHDNASLPLWRENSGLVAPGLDFLMSRGINGTPSAIWKTRSNRATELRSLSGAQPWSKRSIAGGFRQYWETRPL